MSLAGVYSNGGDVYQTLVALGFAVDLLVESNYSWMEVDSLSHDVDDVVVGGADGSTICCQCKKNQTDFKAWSISDLSDDLEKAS